MEFHYSEQHRAEYIKDGFTILRSLIPPSLLTDLRRETDTARDIARQRSGPQAQRLQPVYAYEELDSQAVPRFPRPAGYARRSGRHSRSGPSTVEHNGSSTGADAGCLVYPMAPRLGL